MKDSKSDKKVKSTKAAKTTTAKKADRAKAAQPKMATLTKHHLAEHISEKTGLRFQDVMDVIEMSFARITETLLAGGRAEFRNFGVFSIVTRKSCIGRNPKRPEDVVIIPEREIVKFKPGKIMSDASKKTGRPRKAKKASNAMKK